MENNMITLGAILADATKYSKAKISWDRNPLYDTEGLSTAVTARTINFFTNPQGTYTPGGGAAIAKTKVDTNLNQPNKLGAGNLFILTGFHLQVRGLVLTALSGARATSLTDMQNIFEKGYFEFGIAGGRTRVTIPLMEMGTGMGIDLAAATAIAVGPIGDTTTSVRVVSNGRPSPRNFYKYVLGGNPDDPGVIEGDMTFQAAITFPRAITAPTAGISLRLFLDGIMGSVVQ
jgi:hypothetical protein